MPQKENDRENSFSERKDSFIKQWNRTNSDGYLITEYTQV